jgi:elongation factor G
VLGIEAYEKKAGYQAVIAEVPQAEMSDYVVFLRATTQGRGRFDYEFIRYEEVPSYITEQVVKKAQNA